MSVDVISYPGLIQLERQLHLPQSDEAIGRFFYGEYNSQIIGNGYDMDGLKEYDGGDSRHINWGQSARIPDGKLLVNQFYDEKVPLTIFVSDVPIHERYAKTRGHDMTARALGFVASHLLLRASEMQGSPLTVRWTDGYKHDARTNSTRTYEGENAAKRAVQRGLSVAELSTNRALAVTERKTGRFGFRKRVDGVQAEALERETFSDVLQEVTRRSRTLADMARFIVVSDFRSGFDATQESLQKISRTNDVITVQITHPVLRGEGVKRGDVLAGATKGQNILLETDAQVQKYINDVRAKQARIDAGLRAVSQRTVTLDTAQPDWFKSLKKVA